jgi:hypothetical protein
VRPKGAPVSEDLLPGLRDELVRAASRVQGRHRRRRLTVAAGAVLAAAAVVVIAVVAVDSPDPAAAGVEVEVVNGRIDVQLTNLETRPAVVQAALRDVGLDATVTAVPVGPSNVGRFVVSQTDLPGGIDAPGEDTFLRFSAPVGFRDHLDLGLGLPARDEPYVIASDAYAPGEPLSCAGLYGEPLTELQAFATDHPDLDIVVQRFDGSPGPPLSLERAAADPTVTNLRIADALSPAADTVTVYLTPDGESPFAEPLSPDDGACRE